MQWYLIDPYKTKMRCDTRNCAFLNAPLQLTFAQIVMQGKIQLSKIAGQVEIMTDNSANGKIDAMT